MTMSNGSWSLKHERDFRGAILLDDSDRFYREGEGGREYGYRTQFSGLWVCYTDGHLCECEQLEE